MGEAARRKKLGLPPRSAPGRVRELKLNPPVELVERLEKLKPERWPLEEWLVGALEAFAVWGEQEKQRQEHPHIIIPGRTMPRLPAGSLLGGRA